MEQKDHFQSMLRRGLLGSSPVAFGLAEFRDSSTELTPDSRLIPDDEYWEGQVFYRGERYTFRYGPPPERGVPFVEYGVVRVNSARDALWSLRDHPRLVFDVLGMKRSLLPWIESLRVERGWSEDHDFYQSMYVVDRDEMRKFLDTYGPLTPSYAPPPSGRIPGPMLDEMRMYLPEDRLARFAGRFSELVGVIHEIASHTDSDPARSVVSCLTQIEMSPPSTLYRALLLQLLGHLLSGNPLHRCEGCGRWFSFTDDNSQARHRSGWKRRDARYHSRACLKAASERRRRARLREQTATPPPRLVRRRAS